MYHFRILKMREAGLLLKFEDMNKLPDSRKRRKQETHDDISCSHNTRNQCSISETWCWDYYLTLCILFRIFLAMRQKHNNKNP